MWNNALSINARVTKEEKKLLDELNVPKKGHLLSYLHQGNNERDKNPHI